MFSKKKIYNKNNHFFLIKLSTYQVMSTRE